MSTMTKGTSDLLKLLISLEGLQDDALDMVSEYCDLLKGNTPKGFTYKREGGLTSVSIKRMTKH